MKTRIVKKNNKKHILANAFFFSQPPIHFWVHKYQPKIEKKCESIADIFIEDQRMIEQVYADIGTSDGNWKAAREIRPSVETCYNQILWKFAMCW